MLDQPFTEVVRPASAAELAAAMGDAGTRALSVQLGGHFSKRLMGGPVSSGGQVISTTVMNRVLQYEPRDLTISVEAGMPWADLDRLLAANNQMIPLDPPFFDTATVGGVIAANCSGPRRRLYGTARDMVIGMHFATLEGKLVQTGGIVVKNVAGLDLSKLMIGSFGTLAAIAVVNFKLTPRPHHERTFVLSFPDLAPAIAARDTILRSQLQPAALDLLNAQAAGVRDAAFVLAVQVSGNLAAIDRYDHEFAVMGAMRMPSGPDATLWRAVREFTPRFMDEHPDGAVVRLSCTLKEVGKLMLSIQGPAIARAGSGICYAYFDDVARASAWTASAAREYPGAVIEFAPPDRKDTLDLWPAPGPDLALMQRIKQMFDSHRLLNRDRLYRRI